MCGRGGGGGFFIVVFVFFKKENKKKKRTEKLLLTPECLDFLGVVLWNSVKVSASCREVPYITYYSLLVRIEK